MIPFSTHPPKFIPCVHCNEPFEWIYNEECPKCHTHVEFSLDAHYQHVQKIKEQYEDHLIDDEDDNDFDFPTLPELDNAQDLWEEQLYKLYSI